MTYKISVEAEPHDANVDAPLHSLTNAFSKRVESHAAAIALHFIHYNFARVHKTLRITPAMAAGISDHIWNYEEIAALAG